MTFNNKKQKGVSKMAVTGAPVGSGPTDELSSSRVKVSDTSCIHNDAVYVALMAATTLMETRLKESLENYRSHPDVQANLQQLQYDLQQWNLALTTMTNINKNMGDALNSIASNFR